MSDVINSNQLAFMTNAEGMSSIFLAIIEHQIDLQFWARFCVIDGSFLYG